MFFRKKKKELRIIDPGHVFDKAKYHMVSIEEAGLKPKQAYVHTGLYFSWIVRNNLYSEEFGKEYKRDIVETKDEMITPTQLYMDLDGVFIGGDLNQIGFNFSLDYFTFDKDLFPYDYEQALCVTSPDIFRVEDSWKNYHVIAKIIDQRYEEWQKEYN